MGEDTKLIVDMLKNLHDDVTKIQEKVGDIREEQLRQSFSIDKHSDKISAIESKVLELDKYDKIASKKIERLEIPRKTVKYTVKVVAGVGVIVGTITGIYKLLDYLNFL